MKIKNPILYCLLFFAILFFSCKKREDIIDESNQPNLTNIDTLVHENKISSISTVTIGNQIWMTKNLDVITFRNGDTIFEAKSNEDWKRASKFHIPAYCYYDNDSENGKKYGCLYNWYAVMDERGLAPLGYHIPNNEEYNFLLSNLGLRNVTYHGLKINHKIATMLQSTSNLWSSVMDRNNETATNSSGFSALPGGLRYEDSGSFNLVREEGNWWSSENIWDSMFNQMNSNKGNPGVLSIDYWVSGVGSGFFDAGTGLSVRCIKGEIKRTTKIPILENEHLELDEDGKPREGTYTFGSRYGGASETKTFINGVENGIRISYDEHGKMSSKCNYKNGVQNGEWVSFYNDGINITEKGNYVDGKKEGEWIKYIVKYSLNLQKEWIVGRKEIYKNGVLDGKVFEYDKDGNLHKEIKYKNGIIIKFLKYWENGITNNDDYINSNGEIERIEYNRYGKMTSKTIEDKNGEILSRYYYDGNGNKL